MNSRTLPSQISPNNSLMFNYSIQVHAFVAIRLADGTAWSGQEGGIIDFGTQLLWL